MFSPSKLKEIIPDIQMRLVTEPGEIQECSRYYGEPTPYGACCISTPEEVEESQRIEWMADFIARYVNLFKVAGASDIGYTGLARRAILNSTREN